MPWLTTLVTSDMSFESSGFSTTTTNKPCSNSPLIVGVITMLLRRGRVWFSLILRSILFILHWARTPTIGLPVSGVLILNPTHDHKKWKLKDTLIVHSLFHLRPQAVQKLHTF